MGRKSIKPDKNVYQQIREELDLTRESASELLEGISENQLVRYENGSVIPQPEDVLIMANKYKKPELCNYYCTNECAIGKQNMPEIKLNTLAQITIELLASLNNIQSYKDRLIEIVADGEVTPDEASDFDTIQNLLGKMSISISELQLWIADDIAKTDQ